MADEAVDPWIEKLRPAPGAGSTASGSARDPWEEKLSPTKPSFLQSLSRGAMTGMGVVPEVGIAAAGKNEFDFPEIGTIMGGASFDERNTGLDFARGETAMIDVLKKQDPNLQIAKDKYDNIVVNFKGKPFYLNKSGISERDVRDFGRDILTQLPAAAAATWATGGMALPIRVGAQMVAGGAGSIASDVASSAAGSEQPLDLQAAIVSALGGGAGEMAGSMFSGVIRAFRERPAAYVTPQGQLTPQGVQVVTELGFDPADVGDRLARTFADRVNQMGPQSALRTARADEFGIRLTPGQASGDVTRQSFEEAAENNARGQVAGDLMRERKDAMRESVITSRDRLVDDLAPGATASRQETASNVLNDVRSAEDFDRTHTNAMWENARDASGSARIPRAALSDLLTSVQRSLRAGEVYRISPELQKASNAAMEFIRDIAENRVVFDNSLPSQNAASNLGVTLEAVDSQIRKVLSDFGGEARKSPADARAFRPIVRGYEGWLDNLQDSALMSGDPAALQLVRDARAASADLFRTYGKRDAADRAGATLERMIDEDVTSTEVANWLWGTSKDGRGPEAYRMLRRITEVVGRESEGFQGLRRGMLQTVLMNAPEARQQGAQAMAENLFKFINGDGSPIARFLFTPAELSQLRRYGAAIRDTIPDPRATNPSRSGYAAARAVIDAFGGMGAPMRLFTNVTVDLPNIAKAAGNRPPVVRTPPSAVVPAAAAAGAQREFGAEE